MKRIGISISVILLSVLILLGSGGFTIGKMICFGSVCEYTAYSLGNAKDCCSISDPPSEPLNNSCCCELINVSYTLDDYHLSQKINVSALHFELYYLPSAIFHLPLNIASSINIFTIADLPPPDTKGLLYSFRALLL